MSRNALAVPLDHYYSPEASESAAVSVSATALLSGRECVSSVTLGHDQNAVFARVINARAMADHDNWDGNGAPAISERTVSTAIGLLYALPGDLPAPEVMPESTGEIAFEWYRDKAHVAVVTVQDGLVRWSGVGGTAPAVYGAEPFSRAIPAKALKAVRAAVGSR